MISVLKEVGVVRGSSKRLLKNKAYPRVTSNHLGLKSGPACDNLNQFF